MGGIVAGNLQRHAEIVVDELAGSGAESGLQVAVFHDARWLPMPPVVSLTPAPGGGSRPARCSVRRPRPRRAASTVAHVLAERGVVGYDPRLAEVWPEFAARGKGRVTLRHVLCHTAGVPGLPADTAWLTFATGSHVARRWPPRSPGGSPVPGSAITL